MDQNNTASDDASLVALVLAGEQHSFQRLLNRYIASVTRLCARILYSEYEAQDVVQEATLQAFLNLPRLKKPERFGAWYHAIAANLSYSMLRHRRQLSLPVVGGEAPVKMLWTSEAPTLDGMQSARDLHDAIIGALQDLSEVNRQAVIGYYIEGYNYTELAQLLGVPISTVKGRLFEGRRYLRGVLRPLAESRLQPTARKRKESTMETSELLELHIASFSEALLTREQAMLLRVADTDAFLSLALTRAESELLAAALAGQQLGQALPHDLTLQLLAPLGAQVDHIVVDVLTKQTLYATLTVVQRKQRHQVNVRLIDALLLAVRLSLPTFVTHAVLEAASRPVALADIPDHQAAQTQEPQAISTPEAAKETPPIQPPPALTLRTRYELYERIWPFLLEGLLGAQEMLDPAQTGALDLALELSPHRIIWEQQPMIALRVPDSQKTAWLLVQPEVWRSTATAASTMGFAGSDVLTMPVTFSSTVQQQVDACFERLLINLPVETVILSQPDGALFAWKSSNSHVAVDDLSRKMIEGRVRVKKLAHRRPKPHLLTFSPSSRSSEPSKSQILSRLAQGKTSQIEFSVYGGTLGIVLSSPQSFHDVMDSLEPIVDELKTILATADDIS